MGDPKTTYPVGYALLKVTPCATLSAKVLLNGALPPTIIATVCFWGLSTIGL